MEVGTKEIALGAVGLFGLVYAISELRYQRSLTQPRRDALADVKSKDPSKVESGLNALTKMIDADKQCNLGTKAEIIDLGLSTVATLFSKDCLNKHSKHVLSLGMKVLQKCCEEPEGRTKCASLNIVESLLRLLAELSNAASTGYSAADSKLLGDIAMTLAAATTVDEKKIILEGDVPAGSECALKLLRSRNLKAVFEMVSFDVRNTTYIQSLTKCFANIALLEEGVNRLRDIDALPQVLSLLDKPILEVKENAIEVLKEMVSKDAKTRSAFSAKSPCDYLSPFLAPQHHKHTRIMECVLRILDDILYKGTKEEAAELGEALAKNSLYDALAGMMGKDLPRTVRQLAEEVLLTALHMVPDAADHVKEAIQSHQMAIQKRKRMDQEEMVRKMKEQKQQQQFLEMMAMREMFGGGGGEEDDQMAQMAQMMGAMGGGGMGGMGGGGAPFMEM